MHAERETRDGYRLRIGRIDRRLIDRFASDNPVPDPPTRTVEVFGDLPEEMPDFDNPGYNRDLADWMARVGIEQMDVFAPAIAVLNDTTGAMRELGALRHRRVGITRGDDHADVLRYVVLRHHADMVAAVEAVMYHSTVTERGIAEAVRLYGVTWDGKPVAVWGGTPTPGGGNYAFRHRRAALYGGYPRWSDFCALAGPEQSEVVAFYLLNVRLETLMAHQVR